MKTKLLLTALSLSALMQAQTYTNSTVTPIPDATGCAATAVVSESTSVINVPLTETITDPTSVTINLNLTHTWCGDVVVRLEKPGATSCALIKRLGAAANTNVGDSSDFAAGNQLSFNSANTTVVDFVGPGATAPIPAGNYAPTGVGTNEPAAVEMCNLATFLNGTAVNGDWSLSVSDYCADDTGTLETWSLVFNLLSGEEFVFTNAFSVLGNPFENELVVRVNKGSNSTMNLYSMDGKLVNQTSITSFNQNISIDTTTLSKGVYVLVAEIDGVTHEGLRVIRK